MDLYAVKVEHIATIVSFFFLYDTILGGMRALCHFWMLKLGWGRFGCTIMLLHFLFPEITGSEAATSTDNTDTTDTTDITNITALAVGVAVGAALLITVAMVVVIATIYWIKKKQKKSFNSEKERKTYHTSTEKFVKETDL